MASRAVLITGCSSGIGEATALRLARAGWPVYATARRPDTLAALVDAGCTALPLDVVDEASMVAAVERITADHGAVGALINNAGYSLSGAVESLDPAAIRRQFDTNVFGLVRLTQLCLPGMRAQGAGRVVNVSSMGGRLVFPGGGAYHATKWAVEAFSEALRFEVAGFGVDVVLIEPGLISTGFAEVAAGSVTTGIPAYDAFNEGTAVATKRAYQSATWRYLGGHPDHVARAIERALTARRPRARYPVTPSATLFMAMWGWLPSWAWDRFMDTIYPRPG